MSATPERTDLAIFRHSRLLPTPSGRHALIVRRTSGAPWVQINAFRVWIDGQKYALSLAQDGTERIRMLSTMQPGAWHKDDQALMPMVGTIWTHKSGRLYIVEHIANLFDAGRYPAHVVYRGEDGLVFSKEFMRWYDSMTFQADGLPLLHGAARDWWTTDYRKDMTA